MKTLAALAATTALALGATACGGSDEDTTSAPAAAATTEQAQAATPVAEIPSLSGKDTAVTLDAGFVEAARLTLKLTPAPVGDREDQQGRRRLLPDHRRQRDLLHARAPSPRTCRA